LLNFSAYRSTGRPTTAAQRASRRPTTQKMTNKRAERESEIDMQYSSLQKKGKLIIVIALKNNQFC
jgi:hypothetical protein